MVQPEAITSFIDKVVAASFQELPAVLADFQWTFDKACPRPVALTATAASWLVACDLWAPACLLTGLMV